MNISDLNELESILLAKYEFNEEYLNNPSLRDLIIKDAMFFLEKKNFLKKLEQFMKQDEHFGDEVIEFIGLIAERKVIIEKFNGIL